MESDVVDGNEIGGKAASAVTKRRVQLEAMSAFATKRTISMRQHTAEDEADLNVTFKTMLPKVNEQNDCNERWNLGFGFGTPTGLVNRQ